MKCQAKTEVWARCVGFFSPTSQFNRGKREEFKDRKYFIIEESERREMG